MASGSSPRSRRCRAAWKIGRLSVDALQNAKPTDLPRGPVELDEYGNPIENVYVRRVERVNGELQNTVIDTFPRVSQFWKYNPAEYLKQPLYSRRVRAAILVICPS